MKKIYFLFCCLFFVSTLPLHAQWQRGMRAFKANAHRPKTAAYITNLASKKEARQAALQTAKKQRVSNVLQNSILLLEMPSAFKHWDDINGTAFVIEETYRGKRQLWGVSASHYRFIHPVVINPKTKQELPLLLVAQGSSGFNDITLFPLPEQIKNLVQPLPLAKKSVQLGDPLHSAGYFDDAFQLEEQRMVKEISPHLILTSLHVEDKLAREGACGGPVLNKKGEVVGMHAGSSKRQQVGFVIPVEHIREALYAYHHHGKAYRTLRFQGQELGKININEHIQLLETWKGGLLLNTLYTYHNQKTIDYEHLEDMIDTMGADKLVLTIEREPFSVLEKDQMSHFITLSYDLRSHQVTIKEDF